MQQISFCLTSTKGIFTGHGKGGVKVFPIKSDIKATRVTTQIQTAGSSKNSVNETKMLLPSTQECN